MAHGRRAQPTVSAIQAEISSSSATFFMKYPFLYNVTSKSALSLFQNLQELIAQYGPPSRIYTDNGPPFASEDFKQFLQCQCKATVPAKPQSGSTFPVPTRPQLICPQLHSQQGLNPTKLHHQGPRQEYDRTREHIHPINKTSSPGTPHLNQSHEPISPATYQSPALPLEHSQPQPTQRITRSHMTQSINSCTPRL